MSKSLARIGVNAPPTDPRADEKSASVLFSGASGMLGAAVSRALLARGAAIVKLVRKSPATSAEIEWNPVSGLLNPAQLESAGPFTAAIHLSGANVSAQRWTPAYKREMRSSRVDSSRLLAKRLAALTNPPAVLICAAATGFYGDRGSEILDEDSPAGQGYFPQLCSDWEAAAEPAEAAGIRVVHLRFGVVIGPDGGIVARLAPLFQLGLGGPLGNGRQWMSWVSEADVVAAALFALNTPTLAGSVNVTSPNPATNKQFTQAFAQAVHRPAIFPAPAFALRLAFGQMADEALLSSTRAIPTRLPAAGFHFVHPTLADALAAALAKS